MFFRLFFCVSLLFFIGCGGGDKDAKSSPGDSPKKAAAENKKGADMENRSVPIKPLSEVEF